MKIDEPTGDLYKIMDEAGLNGGNLLDSKRSMAKIINQVRTDMAMKLKSYIVRRDHQMFDAGVKSKKTIEIKEES